MKLSILVKTYNEELKLGMCLTAIFDALLEWGGEAEVIVADSRSEDATVEVALQFPVTVVRLGAQEPRGCGTGVQMGFQHSVGDFVLVLDGDMELQPGFLPVAFRTLAADPKLAGVAGIAQESVVRNRFDRHRIATKGAARCGVQTFLGGGALYRRAAIQDAGGYAADRNLHAFEEMELGLRLGARGWKLQRLPVPFVKHTGHPDSTYALAWQMWRNGRMATGGVLLRLALWRPWFLSTLRPFSHSLATIVYWPVLAALFILDAPQAAISMLAAAAAVFLLLLWRKGSVADAVFSVVMWHVVAVGMLQGFTQRIIPPTQRIESEVIATPKSSHRASDMRLRA